MKNLKAFFALLLVCSTTGIVKAQPGTNSVPDPTKESLTTLNFIDGISFTPSGIVKPDVVTKTNKPTAKVSADPANADAIEQSSSLQFKYAMLLDVEVEAIKNLSLYKIIEEWYGTHYRMGGTTKKGIDCSAFTGMLLMSAFSFSVPRTAKEQYNASERVDKEDLLEGDLVFFNTRGGVSHVGMYLSNGYFVHSSSSQGVTISNLSDGYYSRKFISGGRIDQ